MFLQLLLEEQECHVVNLGACVPVDVLVAECLRHHPDVIVISTVNGHGHFDGTSAVTALRAQPRLRDVRVVIGGKIGTLGADNDRYAQGLLDAGFDAVFLDRPLDDFTTFVRAAQRGALTGSVAT